MKIGLRLLLRGLAAIAAGWSLAGCMHTTIVMNVGGTVNCIDVTKQNENGRMISETTAEEQNPASTEIRLPLK